MSQNTQTTKSSEPRPKKYLYGWKFYVNYGLGFEYETFEDTLKGMKENRKAYQENCRYPLKISRGRELNPDYEQWCLDHPDQVLTSKR